MNLPNRRLAVAAMLFTASLASLAPLGTGRLAAQLPAADHAAKRQTVIDAMTSDGILFVEGSGNPTREDQDFMQSQNFQALTGVLQPGSALIIWKKGGTVGQRIVVPPKPAYAWEGEQIGPEDASRMMGIPGIPTTAMPALLDSLDAKHSKVYLIGEDTGWPGLSTQLKQILGDSGVIAPRGGRRGGGGGGGAAGGRAGGRSAAPAPNPAMGDYFAISTAMNQARARKTDAEIALLRKAAEISVEGHKAAMRMVFPGVYEYQIRGVFEGTIFGLGAERYGYPSIVGAGADATYLHYSADTMQSKAGDAVVMDAAADYHGYSADVTRTFPVSGKFSPEQKIIYEAVLAAQTAAAATVHPGSTSAQENAAANLELQKGLVKAGLIDSIGAMYEAEGGRKVTQLSLFYFHGLGHGLGLNVHDPIYTESGAYVKNSIFTIEPGLYVRPMSLQMVPDVPGNAAFRARLAKAMPKYSGIGTRIEDDFVVTDRGVVCLSCGAPHSLAEVEAVAGKNPLKH
ncbi:MAG TPA: aminopeptidase P N-terminal domain-containing protein [Gemmatimonadales bacterium]